jgi:hypothetical protein
MMAASRLGCLALAGRRSILAQWEKRLRDVSGDKRQLADALRTSAIVKRDRLTAFTLDEATAFAASLLPSTTASAARQR